MKGKPNILVVLVDQMRYHAMKPAGNTSLYAKYKSNVLN